MARDEESAIIADYGERFRARDLDAARVVEKAALGSDCGANGYTTLEQADRLADLLPLRPWDHILDLGCGCGWPGLHLANRYGCRVVGADLPLEGLARAGRNARTKSLETSLSLVCGSARFPPFRRRSFDAVVHADVLC